MKTIVYPETLNYDFMFQRPQQLCRSFSKLGNKTIFINKNYPTLEGAKTYTEYEEKEENHFIYPQGTLPNEFSPFTMYYTFPHQVHDIDFFKPEFTIFDSCDEPKEEFAFWNINGEYDISLRKADLVLASAQSLYEKAKDVNDNVLLVPNACDFNHFYPKPKQRPRLFEQIDKPIVLYVGALASWLDKDLIMDSIEAYPEYAFVFIGGYFGLTLTKNYDNVFLLNHQPYKDLPQYLHHADVLTIPFNARTEVIKSCNPIKSWEYLCTGKPVVTTAMPETKKPEFFWSKDSDEYINNIQRGMRETSHRRKEARIQLARENSWDERARIILEKMEEIQHDS